MNYAVLGLLHYKNLHGYRIRELIERQFDNMWTINPEDLLSAEKLEEEGLIIMVEVYQNEDKGPHRKMYAITEKEEKNSSGG